MAIVVTEPMENNVIKHYEADVKGGRPEQSRTAQASDDPSSCTVTRLRHSNHYTVAVKACVHGPDGCGSALEK